MTASEKSLQEVIIETIATHDVRLPVFNPVVLRLQKALHREDVKIAEIEAMIVEDQTLASQILRVANAAFYRGLQQATTIRKAIIRLGIQQVANLAMVVAQQNLYKPGNLKFALYLKKLWQHAFASAMASKWLAERTGYRSEADTAFLAGLLHNIGQLALLKVLEDLHANRAIMANLPENLIVELLDSDLHTSQGYALMQRWNLPDEYRDVVQNHHQDMGNASNILLIIVRLVDQACDKIGIGLHHDPQIDLAATPEAQVLGVGEIPLAEMEILLEDSVTIASQT